MVLQLEMYKKNYGNLTKKEQNQRNLIEGKFEQAKNKYGLKKIERKHKQHQKAGLQLFC